MSDENLWGPETQNAIQAFPVSNRRMPWHFLSVLIEIKRAAAATNAELGLLDHPRADAIIDATDQLLNGKQPELFPVDVYQAGSGTSSNMNVNELVATLASLKIGIPVLPHEHVNLCQSSNDVVPTAMRIALLREIDRDLRQAIDETRGALLAKAEEFWHVIKVARTHLQDATPIRLGQEFWGWSGQLDAARERLAHAMSELRRVPLGGTAVGTGLNAHPQFARLCCERLSERLRQEVVETTNHFSAQSNLDDIISAHAAVRTTALALFKIGSDIRLLATGPRAGLGELVVPNVRVSSSIMPGKVPPSVVESLTMAVARVIGNDATVAFAQTGSVLELNVMMPIVIDASLESVELLAAVARNFTQQCVSGIRATDVGPKNVSRSVMLSTALAPHIGHRAAADITAEMLESDESIEVVAERHGVSPLQFAKWVDPEKMTGATSTPPWKTDRPSAAETDRGQLPPIANPSGGSSEGHALSDTEHSAP